MTDKKVICDDGVSRRAPKPATSRDVTNALPTLRKFITKSQLAVMLHDGEELQFYRDKLVSIANIVTTMPMTYEQDDLGDEAIAHLHYFRGGMDWYITERDSDPDGAGQNQAFGLANLGHGGELGYISIIELLHNGIELDLYFAPCSLGSVCNPK